MILSEELVAIITALDRDGIDYAVCGGFAVGLHGYPRMTFDLDLLIQEADVTRFEATVKPLGFDVVAGAFTFRRGTPQETRFWRVSKHDGPDHLVLDALLVTPVFAAVWETRQRMRFDDHDLWVVSREGLTTMKTVSGRAKDFADLQNLGILPSDEDQPEPV